MSSFWKLLWDQPIRGVLRRPSELAAVTRHVDYFRADDGSLRRQ